MDNEDRKEIAKQIVEELRKDEKYGECRLFSRDQADSLRAFADHWEANKKSYFGLVDFGHAFNTAKSKAWVTVISLAVLSIFILAVAGAVSKIKGIVN